MIKLIKPRKKATTGDIRKRFESRLQAKQEMSQCSLSIDCTSKFINEDPSVKLRKGNYDLSPALCQVLGVNATAKELLTSLLTEW